MHALSLLAEIEPANPEIRAALKLVRGPELDAQRVAAKKKASRVSCV